MVFSLWAIVITVESLNLSLISLWMVSSVLISMLAVASSIKTILLFLRMALQIQMSCLSPELRLLPFCSICCSRPLSSLLTRSSSEASLRTSSNWFVEQESWGSRLYLRVPSNRVGSWGMIAISSLRFWRLNWEISWPSISIQPESASTILQRASQMVDFPAPVLPTTPTLCLGMIVKFKFLRTSSVSGLYLRWKFTNWIFPLWGHDPSRCSYGFWLSWGIVSILVHLS